MKASGLEFKQFYNDDKYWSKGVWHEEEIVTINGKEVNDDFTFDDVKDEDEISIKEGMVYLNETIDIDNGISFDSYFRKWKKEQNTVILLVNVQLQDLEKVKEAIKNAGGKIKNT